MQQKLHWEYMKKFSILELFLFSSILFIILLNFFFLIASYKNVYLSKFDAEKAEKIYQSSQFAKRAEDRRFIIEDPDLYSLAGYQYLRGTSPSDLVFEHPPLLKYLFGLSLFIFGNANIIQSLFGVLFLVVLFSISKEILKNRTLALIPILLLSFDGVFKTQFVFPFLDLGHLLIISLAIFFFLKAKDNRNFYVASTLFLSLVPVSKYLGAVIIPLLLGFVLIQRRKDFAYLAGLLIILIPLVYFASYLAFFFSGRGFLDFIFLHEKIFRLYRSYLPDYPWGEIWRMLATGNWRVWFGPNPLIRILEWNILWPLTLFATFISFFFAKKETEAFLLILLWAFLYLLSASFHVVFPRHLLLYLPFGYILLTFVGQKLIKEGLLYASRYRR